jgi:hypothetical protein
MGGQHHHHHFNPSLQFYVTGPVGPFVALLHDAFWVAFWVAFARIDTDALDSFCSRSGGLMLRVMRTFLGCVAAASDTRFWFYCRIEPCLLCVAGARYGLGGRKCMIS